MDEIIENIKKENDEIYTYYSVKTSMVQITEEGLIAEKVELEKRLVDINYILSEIGKLKIK